MPPGLRWRSAAANLNGHQATHCSISWILNQVT